MAFVVKKSTDKQIVLELVQDGDDVNILANGRELAYFDAARGRLHLWHCTPEEREAMGGVSFDARGRLAIAE